MIKGKKWLLLSRWNSHQPTTRRAEPAVSTEPARLEGLPAQRKPGDCGTITTKDPVQLPTEMDGSTEVATIDAVREAADMLLKLLEAILSYCRTKVRFGVVEAVYGNIRMLIKRGRGYNNLRYLLLKAKRMAMTNVEFIAVHGQGSLRRAAESMCQEEGGTVFAQVTFQQSNVSLAEIDDDKAVQGVREIPIDIECYKLAPKLQILLQQDWYALRSNSISSTSVESSSMSQRGAFASSCAIRKGRVRKGLRARTIGANSGD
jgi:hypothetical protein